MKYTKEYLMNTKIRVKSPEHSEYIQNLVFSLEGKWADGVTEPVVLGEPYLFIAGDLTLTYADYKNRVYFEDHRFKEIGLPLPESNEDVKLLKDESMSSKVFNIGNVLHNMACSEDDEEVQGDLEGYAHYLWDVAKLLSCEEDIYKTSSAVEAMNKLGYKYCEKEQAWYKEIKEWVK